MGISLLRGDRFLLQAMVLSMVLHSIVAYFIPTIAWLRGEAPSIETLAFVRVTHIAVETPRPVAHPVAATAPQRSPVVHLTKSQPHHALAKSHTRAHSAANKASRAPVVASEETPGSIAIQSSATGAPAAPATPQTEQIASTETRHDVGGYMPFGATQPDPVLDPGVLKALSALKVHTTLTVVVDENGHTKSVAFDPQLDDKTETQIRTMLADAAWDPAVCGAGVACEGRTTIKL